jgi:hypothetical protein
MDVSFRIFIILLPIVIFFTSFFMARQFRPFENTLYVKKLFGDKKWSLLFILVSSLLISALFTFLYSYKSGFSITAIVEFLVLFSLVSTAYYFGFKLGWKNKSPIKMLGERENPTTNQIQYFNEFPENITIENSFSSVKITFQSKKRWGIFVMEMSQWLVLGICAFPLLSIMFISYLQKFLPPNLHFLVWLILAGLIFPILYVKFMNTLEYILDKEIVVINNLSLKIEKSGFNITKKKEYLAENINKITPMFSFGGIGALRTRSPFINVNMPAFVIWLNHGLKRHRTFGSGVDLSDAQKILEIIYTKFPQYKG